jgi:hypothetical protein
MKLLKESCQTGPKSEESSLAFFHFSLSISLSAPKKLEVTF